MTGSGTSVGEAPWRIVDRLNADWQEILESDGSGQGVLVSRASRGCDVTLHALLSAAQHGDAMAARTVLQSMLGRLVQMASRDRRSPVDVYVAAAWCVLARYPLRARPVRIAANLALDTLKAVRQEAYGRGGATLWLAGVELEQLVEQEAQRRELDHGVAAGLDAVSLIEAGRRLRLLDEPSGLLLETVYVRGLSGAEAARRHGSTAGSVRVRCSRALQVLADHADELAGAA
ncbi:RNA polymerase sigma factor [uncultured Friedmanniella sp.]|uniref:RNA polymerase sigma factor n=1 Tax=uncultured Friedmanniella sp. TaxID=335381 RepID=UPI0035CA0630